MRAFIQTAKDGIFWNIECYASFLGFSERGFHLKFFKNPIIELDDILERDVVCGTVQAVNTAFRSLKIKKPEFHCYPEELHWFMGRSFKEELISDFFQNKDFLNRPRFIKPSRSLKLFTGFVVDSEEKLSDIKNIYDIENYMVLVSDTVDFISEYRAFILRGELVGLKNYDGDWKVFPDIPIIERAVKSFTRAPVAYSLDVGITNTGETLLVEANDFYALGAYGLDPIIYTDCLIARWREIVRNS